MPEQVARHGEVTRCHYGHAEQDVYFDKGEDSSGGARKFKKRFLILRTVVSTDIPGLQDQGQKIQRSAEGDNYLVQDKSPVYEGLDVPLQPDQKSSLGRDNLHVAVEAHRNCTRHAAMCDERRDHPHQMEAEIGAAALCHERMRDKHVDEKADPAPDERDQQRLQRLPELMSVGDQAAAIENV